jgi:hypothetical protein
LWGHPGDPLTAGSWGVLGGPEQGQGEELRWEQVKEIEVAFVREQGKGGARM